MTSLFSLEALKYPQTTSPWALYFKSWKIIPISQNLYVQQKWFWTLRKTNLTGPLPQNPEVRKTKLQNRITWKIPDSSSKISTDTKILNRNKSHLIITFVRFKPTPSPYITERPSPWLHKSRADTHECPRPSRRLAKLRFHIVTPLITRTQRRDPSTLNFHPDRHDIRGAVS